MFAMKLRHMGVLFCLLLSLAMLGGCSSSSKEESPNPAAKSASNPPVAGEDSSSNTPALSHESATKPPAPAQTKEQAQALSKQAQQEAAAARTKEAQEKAQQVLERARSVTHVTDEALGKIIVGRAVGTGPEGSFKTDISSPAGGRFWYRRVLEGKKPFEALITPKGAWSIHEDGTKTPLSRRTTLMVQSHDFQRIALDPESFAQNMGWVKSTEFHTLKSEELLGYTEDGTKIYFYYGDKSGLPLGFRMDNPVQTQTSVTIIFREWQEVEGVRMPNKIIALDAPRNFQLDFRSLFFQNEED
jgi:hypothetical protein